MPGRTTRKAALVAKNTLSAIAGAPSSSGGSQRGGQTPHPTMTTAAAVSAALPSPMSTPLPHTSSDTTSDVEEPSSEFVPQEADSDDDEDFVAPKAPLKRKLPAPSVDDMPTAAQHSAAMSAIKRGRKFAASIAPRARTLSESTTASTVAGVGMEEEDSIFSIVKTGKLGIQATVDNWIESYQKSHEEGIVELFQFFIQSAGCKGRITVDMFRGMEQSEIIRKMTEEFHEDHPDYPLIMTGVQWKKLRPNLADFVSVLIRQCQHEILYDQQLMDSLVSFLTGLADSQVRAFRHTSTFVVMKIMSSLVDVLLTVGDNLKKLENQWEAEKQKQQSKKAATRIDTLAAKVSEMEGNMKEIQNLVMYIFKGVFVHRYRDMVPDVRSICIAEVGYWMMKLPNLFLDDSYLKYVGWSLFDKVGDVRFTCLKTLQPLFENLESASRLELFVNRFKERIVEMTLDKEVPTAVAAIKLVTSIAMHNEQVLTDHDSENVYELVYSSNRSVAQAAAEFLNARLFAVDEQQPAQKTRRGKVRSPSTGLLRHFVDFFIESELHEHPTYLVDSMWGINDMLLDWECMTDLLLEDPGRHEEALDDRQERCLIEIMVCCVRQAATGEYPIGRGPANRKLTVKETKQVAENKIRLTQHFIPILPDLLSKFSSDEDKLSSLMTIIPHFEIDIYTTGRQEKHLQTLLNFFVDIVDRTTDAEVLDKCAKATAYLCNEEFAVNRRAETAKSAMLDAMVGRFTDASAAFFNKGNRSEDTTYALFSAVKRMEAFSVCGNITGYDIWPTLILICKQSCQSDNVAHEIVVKVIGISHSWLLWVLNSVATRNPDKPSMKRLRKKLNEFVKLLHELLNHENELICESAYLSICDLLVVFGGQLGCMYPLLNSIVIEADKELQAQLASFLQDKVFKGEEEDDGDENQQLEELYKRRNFLACFAKLVVYKVIEIRNAAQLFKYYIKFHDDYGDILKATLSRAREFDKVGTARTLAQSLTILFTDVSQAHGGRIDKSSQDFFAIKELARRFALSFGLDHAKNREAVAAIHKEGIHFAMTAEDTDKAPNNLTFLEVLCEFVNKLIKQDRKPIMAFLDRYLPNGLPPPSADQAWPWQPLVTYRNMLTDDDETRSIASASVSRSRTRRTRKKDTSVAGLGGDSTLKTPAFSRLGNQMTSTAHKQRPDVGSERGSEADFDTRSRVTDAILEEDEGHMVRGGPRGDIGDLSSLSEVARVPQSSRRVDPMATLPDTLPSDLVPGGQFPGLDESGDLSGML